MFPVRGISTERCKLMSSAYYEKENYLSACFLQDCALHSFNGKYSKLAEQFTYFGCNLSSIKSNVNIHIDKIWPAINSFTTTWTSDLSDKIKWESFQAIAVSVLLYDCTTWFFKKILEKKVHWNYIKILCSTFNRS